jgi:hypothetical protein
MYRYRWFLVPACVHATVMLILALSRCKQRSMRTAAACALLISSGYPEPFRPGLVPLLSPHIFSLYFKYYVAPYDLHSVIYSQKGSLSDAMYLSDVHCLLLEFKNEDSTFKISDATHDAGCVYHRIFVEIFCMLPWTFFPVKNPMIVTTHEQ